MLRSDPPPELREPLRAAGEEADQMGRLAEDLLLLAQAPEGNLEVHAEEVPALAALEAVRHRFADRAEAAGRSLQMEVPPDLTLRADPLRLRQALSNLVDNALRHGEGEVTLAARPAPGGAEVEVRDEGAGLQRRVPRPRLRALHAQRRGAHPRRGRARAGDRPRGGRGARRPGVDRRRPGLRADLPAAGKLSALRLLSCRRPRIRPIRSTTNEETR